MLVVDDDAATRDALHEALSQAGFDVALAHDGQEALEHLRQAPWPRAMVLDLDMPRLRGEDVVRALGERRLLAALPILILTGHALDADLPVRAALSKPVDVRRLVTTLRGLLQQPRAPHGSAARAAHRHQAP